MVRILGVQVDVLSQFVKQPKLEEIFDSCALDIHDITEDERMTIFKCIFAVVSEIVHQESIISNSEKSPNVLLLNS